MTTPYVHYAHTTGKLRVYSSPDGYRNRLEYDAIIEAMWINQDLVQLQAAHGKLGKRELLAICNALYQCGAKQILVQRAKGRLVPWGTLTHSDEHEDTYLISLLEMRNRGLISG